MEALLATVALAVPLTSWFRGTFFFMAPQHGLARALRPLREQPHSMEFQFSYRPDSPGANEVRS
jgi:hypothetical protein